MTAEKDALRLIANSNVSARIELIQLLEYDWRRSYSNKSKQNEIKKEIEEIKKLGV